MVRDKHVVVSSSRVSNVTKVVVYIGVRDGGSSPPPIRAVCRHTFGQRVDIIRAKHNTCLNNTNLGYVTAGNKFCHYPPPTESDVLLLPPPTEYGSRKMSATSPPHRIHSGKTLSAPPPPPMDVCPYAYGRIYIWYGIVLFPRVSYLMRCTLSS